MLFHWLIGFVIGVASAELRNWLVIESQMSNKVVCKEFANELTFFYTLP